MNRLWILGLAFVMAACSGAETSKEDNAVKQEEAATPEERKVQMLQRIAELESAIIKNADVTQPTLRPKAMELRNKYRDYANNNPGDSLTAKYLFKAADLSLGLKEPEQAAGYLNNLIKNHPGYSRRVEAMLFRGFVYEVHLNQHGEAVKAYKALIERYPNHRLANDAQAAIDNLTLSEEELIEKLRANNPS